MNNIHFNVDNLDVTVKDCNSEYIKLYDKNKFYSCESPLCKDECPIQDKRAVCVKNESNNSNNKFSNECKCLDGWIGNNCETQDYEVYDNMFVFKIIYLFLYFYLLILFLYLFIYLYLKKLISMKYIY